MSTALTVLLGSANLAGRLYKNPDKRRTLFFSQLFHQRGIHSIEEFLNERSLRKARYKHAIHD